MNCPLCSDTGWITRPGESDPQRCECVAKAARERLLLNAAVPERFARATFRTWDTGLRKQSNTAFMEASKWAVHYPGTGKRGILLVGAPNTGKTHIAVSCLKEIVSRGTPGLFCDYPSLLESIKAGYDGKSDTRAYEKALHTPMLLLDDLGAHRFSEWVEDTVAGILTHRLNHDLGLIATTNLTAQASTSKANDGRLQVHTTLEDRIGAQAYAKLQQLCTVLRIL